MTTGDLVPGRRQQRLDLSHARRRIEPDRETCPAPARRIVRHHQGQPTFRSGLCGERDPAAREIGQCRNAVPIRHESACGQPGRGIDDVCLERNRNRSQPPVELRQRDLHGEVGGREPAWRRGPDFARAADRHRLQHRAIGGVEHEIGAFAGREGGGRDDQHRFPRRDQGREIGRHGRVLQAGQGQDERCMAACGEGGGERFAHRSIASADGGAVDEDRGESPVGRQGS
jgi:hypothetical protein